MLNRHVRLRSAALFCSGRTWRGSVAPTVGIYLHYDWELYLIYFWHIIYIYVSNMKRFIFKNNYFAVQNDMFLLQVWYFITCERLIYLYVLFICCSNSIVRTTPHKAPSTIFTLFIHVHLFYILYSFGFSKIIGVFSEEGVHFKVLFFRDNE